mmetsp:Transcript_51854/g.155622  ORF Transcript_51854/g.155622 Transcript_51854/m.155622 type:complete len:81 (-) Transcript_51854:226-468(-)|eukprot:CAMPEP_0113540142 /NCGR_PEP_ID=MMETSP0015_2-20120614/8317_1 /TAXON_ID=2838 /ORGANISM="Odontella" /LENGTH=80 /DNA_ID=CAMNT_0000439915 /DNA_START=286 /DNA_END=528 /DNA_ORIENTATION=+ /assembly_acc=CAM_ASM_000160
MAGKKQDTGTDLKSLVINLFTIFFFFLPIVCYFDRANAWNYVGICGISFVIALIVPPMGWLRPHPYSDFPNNKPYPRRDD